MRNALGVAVLFSVPAFTQTATPTFEVASVRVSQIAKAGGEGSRRQSIQAEPGSLTMRNVPLSNAIRWAYGVQEFQVAGPHWLTEERYDIVAKTESNAGDERLRAMLQTLLSERLKLAVHREQKVMPYYLLTVGKGGPKFKESTTEGEPDFHPGPNRTSVVAQHMTVERFCELLSQVLRTPIVNETGLKGRYDANLDLSALIAAFPQGPQPDEIPAMIANGLQDLLGLKLEAKKGPVEMIVVDRAEKVPTEN